MPRITAIINQKGGVGKSTTAHALGAGLTLAGHKVLFVDLDAQGNLSYVMRAETNALTAMAVLAHRCGAAEAVQQLADGALIPNDPGLAGMDLTLNETGKEYRLRECLQTVAAGYDHILLDTPPALGILTVNALTACSGVVIPAQADVYSLQGIGQLYETIRAVRQYCNPSLRIDGILLTRYNPRSILSRDMTGLLEQTAESLGTKVYNTRIRDSIAVREAQASRQSIFEYAPKSNPTADYGEFVSEFLQED